MASATAPREELLDRYIHGHAIETLILTLAGGDIVRGLWSLDGPPLAFLFPEDPSDLQELLGRLACDEWSALWPEEELPPDYYEAWRATDLRVAQMLIALAGNAEFCARAAQRLLERAGAVPVTPAWDDDEKEAGDDA